MGFEGVFEAPQNIPVDCGDVPSGEALWALNDNATQTSDFEFIDTIVWPIRTPSPLNSFGLNLLGSLPWFQLKERLSRITNSSELQTTDFTSASVTKPKTDVGLFSLQSSNRQPFNSFFGVPSQISMSPAPSTAKATARSCQNILVKLLEKDSKSQIVDLVSSLESELRKFLPEQQTGELSTQVHTLFDGSYKQPLQPLLEIVAYLSSNCMLSLSQMVAFVNWVIDQELVERLKNFLQIDLHTVREFRSKLLEAGIKSQKIAFTKQMHGAGAKFDELADLIMEIEDNPDFVLFALARIDLDLLKGEPGGQLLHKHISRLPNRVVVQKLLDAGAEVNISTSNKFRTTILWQAIKAKSLEIVSYLIERGADVDQVSITEPRSPISYACVQDEILIVECLLQNGADATVSVSSIPLIDYVASQRPKIYYAFQTQFPGVPIVVSTQIVAAANSDPKVWSKFVVQYPGVPEQRLEQALVDALRNQKTKAVVNLLDYGVNPNGSHLDSSSEKPLEVATISQDTWSLTYYYMDLLIHAKVDVNMDGLGIRLSESTQFSSLAFEKLLKAGFDLDRYGGEMLECAAVRHHPAVISFLLDKGASLESYGFRFTVLQAVASIGEDIRLLELLILRGAKINALPFAVRGRTALQAAANSRNIQMVRLLCQYNAEINGPIAVSGGLTALEASLTPQESMDEDDEGDYDDVTTEVFRFLLDQGALVNRRDGSCSPLLHDLIMLEATDLLRRVLELGASTNHYVYKFYSSMDDVVGGSRSGVGLTPLQYASGMSNRECVKLLLDYGASLNERPAYKLGRTALQAACSNENPDIELVKLLISHGASVNADPGASGGITALQGAAIQGHINIAQLLIENKAEVNAFPAFEDGRTAIDGAAEHGRLDMVMMLINAGAIGDVVGDKGFSTAISLAKENRHFQIVELLEAQ